MRRGSHYHFICYLRCIRFSFYLFIENSNVLVSCRVKNRFTFVTKFTPIPYALKHVIVTILFLAMQLYSSIISINYYLLLFIMIHNNRSNALNFLLLSCVIRS